MKRRLAFRRLPAIAVAAAAVAVIAPASAGAAITVGSTFTPINFACTNTAVMLQTTSPSDAYVVPTAGVLTSWSHEGGGNPPSSLKLEVGRATVGSGQFLIVGNSAGKVPVAAAMNTYTDISIPVQAGDFLGLRSEGMFRDCGVIDSAYTVNYLGTVDPAPGDPLDADNTSGLRLDVSATLEPDCDADGLGDETEDADISSCIPVQPPVVTPPVVTPPPVVPIVNVAPKTSLKSTVIAQDKVTFKFRSNEAGSTFLCKLDKKAFANCKSPKTYKGLKPGKHKFQVKARDGQGLLDPSPAIRKFEIKE